MTACVPSLEGSLFLTDPQSIIAYTWRRYTRTPKDAVSILPGKIISLPYQEARFGKEPDTLAANMRDDLQGVLSAIFGIDREISVSVMREATGPISCNLNVSFVYTVASGEVNQTGLTISLGADGRLIIPEDVITR